MIGRTGHLFTVAHDCDLVTKRIDFLEFMGNEDDGMLFILEPTHNTKETFGLLLSKRGGRLVENENFSTAVGQGPRNLQQLLLGDGDIFHQGARRDFNMKTLEVGKRRLMQTGASD